MNNKIILDFTQTSLQQDVALMPADLAKRLLIMLAKEMQSASADEILDDLKAKLDKLSGSDRVDQSVDVVMNYINERRLVKAALENNWDAYQV